MLERHLSLPEKEVPLLGSNRGLWGRLLDARGHTVGLTWVLLGKGVLMGSNAALMLLLANLMEIETYGLLVMAISAQLFLSRAIMLGVDVGMIRLRTVPDLREQSQGIVRAGLLIILYATGVVAVVSLGLALAMSLAGLEPWPVWLFGSILAGAVGTALVDYNYSHRLSELRYRAAGLIQSGTGIARLALTAGTALLLPAYMFLVFLAYSAASLFSGMGLTVAGPVRDWSHPQRTLVTRLLKFSLWLGVANMMVILSLYQGTFLLMILGQEAETGIFGLCLTVSLGFFALYNAFAEYILPRMARLKNMKDLQRFLPRALGGAAAIAAVCVPVAIAMGMILPKLLRPEFHDMSTIFYLLSASMLLLIVQSPLQSACVYFLRPHLVGFGWMLQFSLAVLLGVPLAAQWGAVGAAIAHFGAAAGTFVAFCLFVVLKIRGAQKDSATAAGTTDNPVKVCNT